MPDEARTGGDFSPGSGVEARLSALEAGQHAIQVDLAEIKGTLRNVPTTFQLVFMQAGLILTIFPAAFALLRYAPPH